MNTQSDLFSQVVDKESLTFNQRLSLAGVETIREGKSVFLEYKGVRTERPLVNSIEKWCRSHFGIEI